MYAKKRTHEIRDPIHTFIKVDNREREVIDSKPFQRLRNIHQLALSYLVYPGATHKRFEHSLGVMDLAGRVFDVITNDENIRFESVASILPDKTELPYWKRALRAAALCHDIGHLPFSHAAEKELLSADRDHEDLTVALIGSEFLAPIWASGSPINAEHVKKIAVGKKKLKELPFTEWEAILSEIITGDALGVDRIDYLLRDSYHAGVAYGRFDHHRLIDSIRILPRSTDEGGSVEPLLGIEIGGLHTAEALLLARYFMYEQVYCHPIRRIYDIHLKEFMLAHFGEKKYPSDLAGHIATTDNEISAAIAFAAVNSGQSGHESAKLIANRTHYRKIYSRTQTVDPNKLDAGVQLFDAVKNKFGAEIVRFDSYRQRSNPTDFPVLVDRDSGIVKSSLSVSDLLVKVPLTAVDFIFCEKEIAGEAGRWIDANQIDILGARETS
jgi:HD superfamily phosphohydrolase